jgi:hypothetical protein
MKACLAEWNLGRYFHIFSYKAEDKVMVSKTNGLQPQPRFRVHFSNADSQDWWSRNSSYEKEVSVPSIRHAEVATTSDKKKGGKV